MENTEMANALDNFIAAGWKLAEVWDENQVKHYPNYLPSFDELVAEFSTLLEEEIL